MLYVLDLSIKYEVSQLHKLLLSTLYINNDILLKEDIVREDNKFSFPESIG
jgi:hypothetical protein